MEIETKNASLDTLAVTIMALHVSGKQMTQAVFKQLPEGFEQDGDQKWGIVRYQVKNSASLWLVFSNSGHLYRRGLETDLRRYLNGVRSYERALAKHDEKVEWHISVYGYNEDYEKKAEAERLNIALDIEESKADWEEELKRQANEIALSKLNQLFIAV